MSDRWFKVCRRDELKDGTARSITILGRPYAVFAVKGELYGLDSACRHMRANLGAGKMLGNVVSCFMHQWEYDVRSGKCLTEPGMDTVSRAVKIENDIVYISVAWPDE
ncbi:MAG: Rieske (2Fe-2S) protein [bacterium]|nr:Rieske (2Fe-2S) protein [bacterium]MBK8130245.1 Rieske (2Fe-2S) protein [bacterium]